MKRIAVILILNLLLSFVLRAADIPKPAMGAPAKPEITSFEPRGIERGVATRVKVMGKNLADLSAIKFSNTQLAGKILKEPAAKTNEAWLEITAANRLARGNYEFWVTNPGGESSRMQLWVDNITQLSEKSVKKDKGVYHLNNLPSSFWGTIEKPGDVDGIVFEAKAGETLVFDLAAKSLNSKLATPLLTLVNRDGKTLARTSGLDADGNPDLAYKFTQSGRYEIRVSDLMLTGSKEHNYRLTIGNFPYVTDCFPLSVRTNATSEITLIGPNIPAHTSVSIKAGSTSEMNLPIDPEKYRSHRMLKVLVGDYPELVEQEPNNEPVQAMSIPVPASINGHLQAVGKGDASDVDLFRFEARKGQHYIIETTAARIGSPADTKLEVLSVDGKPVERVLLQAVRDSQINFRGIDSNTLEVRVDNWQEMELNEYLYLQGEVCKIFRMPRGPDSGFQFYAQAGKRRDYFDTNPTTHALDEPCYVVEPRPPGSRPYPNGLPVFHCYFMNDDDSNRELGTDSRLNFIAPETASYLIRVTESRNFSGELYAYRLVVREAKPDFAVSLGGTNPTIPEGSGESFALNAQRVDGFDGDIRVDISGVPEGYFASSPIVVQAGHLEAEGTLFARTGAKQLSKEDFAKVKVTATATINGQTVRHDINNFGNVQLGPKPKLLVLMAAGESSGKPVLPPAGSMEPQVITIAPGETVPAWLMVVRSGETNLLSLNVNNLPHGIIVDNIGLNGVQIRAGENDREIFLTAAKWVPETDRLCHAVSGIGRQTSFPVLIRVRRHTTPPATTAAR